MATVKKFRYTPRMQAQALVSIRRELDIAGRATVALARQKASGERVRKRTGTYHASFGYEIHELSGGPHRIPIRLTVYNHSPVAEIIEKGSRPHVIRARNAPRLVFQVGFAGSNGGIFGIWRAPESVQHPGTRPQHILRDSLREGLSFAKLRSKR